MLLRKNFARLLILIFSLLICVFGVAPVSAAADTHSLYLGGFPAGFSLNTTTVEVIGICDVLTAEGMKSPARDAGIKTGDIVEKINGEEVNKTSDITDIVLKDYKKFIITVLRASDIMDFEIKPAVDASTGLKRLGILVKDSISGVGTVTYIDKLNNKFASLGHPVTDFNSTMIDINGGTVYGCLIYEVKKGVKGTPGELRGAFENNYIIGKARKNCACGIYGDISNGFDVSGLTPVDKASIENVKIGKAYIFTTLHGNQPKKYEISIVKVDKHNKDNRNFVIKIDDEELLKQSGGIVQGMSGSPIIQNGKLIGAVTHVFVNDPARGYGIAIDKMLSSY